MKRPIISLLALALAAAPIAGRCDVVGDANGAPPASGLPNMNLSQRLPGQANEVQKLVTSGISADIIKAYIDNAPTPFNLTPDNIIQLQQSGLPPALTSEMLNHDGALRQNGMGPGAQAAPPVMLPPGQAPPGGQAPPPAGYDVTQPAYDPGTPGLPADYYDSDLAQYGAWQYVPDSGWCWAPYDWAWGYSYPWGLGVFGSGRWCNFPGRGWFWRPGAGFHGHWTGWGGGHFYGGFHGTAGFHTFGGVRGGFGGSHGFAGVSHSGPSHFAGGGFHGTSGGFHGGGGGGGGGFHGSGGGGGGFHGGGGGGGGHGGGGHR